MISYQDAIEALHTRGLSFDIQQYLFVVQCALSEDVGVAYGIVYDTQNFKRIMGTEDEEEYIAEQRKAGEVMLQQQECQHLKTIIEDWKRSEIQNEASNLKNFKYSTADVAQMLSNLLFERSKSLEDASVRDIVQLIRELNAQGALDGSDSAFSKHFISVLPHMSVLCPVCQKESDIAVGMTCYCSRCGAEFRWNEEERRYYPQPQSL